MPKNANDLKPKTHPTVEKPRDLPLPGEALPDDVRKQLAPIRVRDPETEEESPAEKPEYPILAGDALAERPIHLSVTEARALITAILGEPGDAEALESALSRMQALVERGVGGLPSLDVHGVGDDGWYHPPSRKRYLEMLAYETKLEERLGLAHRARERAEKRVDELLAEASTRINEVRMLWARVARNEKARAVLWEGALADTNSDEARESVVKLGQILADFDRLEKDVWGQTVGIARAFVEAMKIDPTKTLAEAYAERFRVALDL